MRKLLILVGLLLMSVTLTGTALAQEIISWTCTFEFSEGDGGFTDSLAAAGAGVYSGGAWVTETVVDPPGQPGTFTRMILMRETLEAYTLTFISATYDILDVNFNNAVFAVDDETTRLAFAGDTGGDAGDIGLDKVEIWEGSVEVPSPSYLVLYIDVGGASGTGRVESLTISGESDVIPFAEEDGITCEVTAGYTRPLLPWEVSAFGIIDDTSAIPRAELPTDDANQVTAFSSYVGAQVFAAASGTVTTVQPATVFDCPMEAVPPDVFPMCAVRIDAEVTGGVEALFYQVPRAQFSLPQRINAWLVIITAGDKEFHYVVDNAPEYVEEGMEIEAGCIVGKTLPMVGVSGILGVGDELIGIRGTIADYGLAMLSVYEDGEMLEILSDLTLDPDGQAACNIDPDFATCLGDGKMNSESNWDTNGAATFNNPGFILSPGASVLTNPPLNLDPAREPQLVVNASSLGNSSEMMVRLGATTMNFNVTGTDTNYIIPGDTHSPDAGAFYTVLIQDIGANGIKVNSACVQFTKDGEGGDIDPPPPNQPPDEAACRFTNPSFNTDNTGWTVSGSVETGTGELLVPDGETIGQSVTLEAGTYTLNIVTTVWAFDSYIADDENTTGGILLEYAFPSSYTTVESHTWAEFANVTTVVYSVSVVVASDTTDTFNIRPDISSAPTGVRGVAVRAVCIGTEEDGGGLPDDPGETGGGIFQATCNAIPLPTGNDVSERVSWLWANLNSFFQCDLMKLLNSMYSLAMQQYRLFRWSLLYNQALISTQWEWITNQGIPWLGGHLSNIAVGQVTTITASPDECGNIFCLITAIVDASSSAFGGILDVLNNFVDPDSPFWNILGDFFDSLFDFLDNQGNQFFAALNRIIDVLTAAIGLLGTILVGIVSFVLLLIVKAFELFDILVQIIVMILTSWINAVPVESAILPSCATDQTSARCIFFYIADRTIFTESGAFFIPVIAGSIYLNLFIWVVNRLKKALTDLGVLS